MINHPALGLALWPWTAPSSPAPGVQSWPFPRRSWCSWERLGSTLGHIWWVFMAGRDGEEDLRQSSILAIKRNIRNILCPYVHIPYLFQILLWLTSENHEILRCPESRGGQFYRFSQLSFHSMDRAEASQTYQDWQQRWTPSQGVASADHAGHTNLSS